MSQQKQKDDFIAIIEQHKGIIYKIALSYARNPSDKADIAQEIIIQLWRSFPKYNSQYKYSTWIYRIALNVSISYFRKTKKLSRIQPTEADYFLNISELDDSTEKKESESKQLHAFIDELKPINKAIILLYLEDKTHQHIAEIIGITPSNVGTRINRIKASLKQKFSTI